MRKILLLLALLPTLLAAQTDSWVRFAVQYDYWANQESGFTFVSNANGDTILYHEPTQPFEYLDTIVNCNSGQYLVTLSDSYGDGWNSTQGGIPDPTYFKMMNDCQGPILTFDPLTQSFFTLDTLVDILPCAPPITGCTDSNALNYDSLATIEDGSCTYPPCSGLIFSNAYQNCQPNGQALTIFEWETAAYNQSCEVTKVWISNENGLGPYEFPGNWPAGGPHNFAFNTGPGQMPPNWSVEFYCQLEFADGSLSDTIAYTPYSCIPGCLDPAQISYNPWATIDDGSCSGTTCDTATQYQVSISLTLDNWPGETSWQFVDGLGNTFDYPIGTYDFNDIGQTYTYTFCVSQTAQFEMIINDDYGDGLAGSTSGGSIDGAAVIYDCTGDTIWYMDNPGFGTVLYSGPQNATPCPTIPDILGCMDDDYVEYNPAANIDDGSCTTLHTYGCTDSTAFNFDPLATIMDLTPDCNYELWIGDAGGDGWGNSFIGVYQNGINLGTYTMGPGNYQNTWNIILDPGVPVEVFYFEVGGPQQPPQEVQFQTWHNSFKLTNADGVVLMHEGQNPFANNGQGALQSFESPFWTKYVGIPFCGNTCIPTVYGCTDTNSFNYNPLANVDDNSCIPFIYGCTNVFAINYDPLANVDDSSCIPFINGCTDPTADNYNFLANIDDGSCYYIGCMDITACNYDSTATISNGCQYPITFYDCFGNCINDSDGDGVCDELEVLGCTNPVALNYDVNATDDDGSCILPIYGCTDPTMFNYDPNANTDNGSCEPYIYGCMDSLSYNYDPTANTDNGSCVPFIYGCTDPTSFTYDPLANTNDNTCCYVSGCMDEDALNYNSDACFDDGSCITIVTGCTDVSAFNYDPTANVSDPDACLYDAGCYGGPGVPYWLNDGCYAWVINVDDYCCTNDWDVSCQSMYDYCQNGWPVSIEEADAGTIVIYPNPTPNIINIDTRLELDVEVYTITGELVLSDTKVTTVNFNELPAGIYNLVLIHNDKIRINKRVIKQ